EPEAGDPGVAVAHVDPEHGPEVIEDWLKLFGDESNLADAQFHGGEFSATPGPEARGPTLEASSSLALHAAATASTATGIVRSLRTGDTASQQAASSCMPTAAKSICRNPSHSPPRPPAAVPNSIAPNSTKRMLAFMRPCKRSGVIACRRLMALMS